MTFTESGSTAIELLDKYPFDAVVTDMEMPVVQGWRLLRHIGEKHPAVVKIMLTGNCDMFTALMQVPGHFDYLTKPVNVDALKLLILRRLSEPPQEELPPQAMRTHINSSKPNVRVWLNS